MEMRMISPLSDATGYNQTDIRLYNLGMIFRAIRDAKLISRATLAKLTGLNPATITHIVRELIDSGLIEQAGSNESHSGRPSVLLRVRSQAGYVIAVHLDRYFMRGMITNLGMEECIHSEVAALPSSSPTAINIDTLVGLIDALILGSGLAKETFFGIGICAPGPLDAHQGVLLSPPNFPGWPSMPIRQILEDRFSLPTFLDQDANACALAEKMFGDMRESNNFVFLLADGGLGGGIFTNGNIYRGEHDIAGEIGHTTIDINGPQCSCGNVGCLELYASPHAVEQFVASKLLASPQNENSPFFNSPDSVTFENITHAARNGDALSCAALDRMAHALAAGIVNLINSFDPQAVVIGGKIALAQDLIGDRVNQMVRQRTLSGNASPVPVKFSSLGQEVQIVGAFSLVLRELFQNPVSPEKSTR
jgi:predicted NBD/HSP70 family sugar kinase